MDETCQLVASLLSASNKTCTMAIDQVNLEELRSFEVQHVPTFNALVMANVSLWAHAYHATEMIHP